MIFRHDDFGPRVKLERAKQVHQEFLDRDLVETACIQAFQAPTLGLKRETVAYLKSSPGYDIQLHCWEHHSYHDWALGNIVRDLSAAMFYVQKTFGRYPTVLYPAYNASGKNLEAACNFVGLELRSEATSILHYVGHPEAYLDTPAVYFHSWSSDDMAALPRLLDLFKS